MQEDCGGAASASIIASGAPARTAGARPSARLTASCASGYRDCGGEGMMMLSFICSFRNKNESAHSRSGRHPVLKYRVPHGSQPRPGWAPDPLMVGIRSPDGLVVAPATLEFWDSKREEPWKTGRHPVLKYRVPHGSQAKVSAVMARRRRRRPPGGHTTAGSGGRRAPFSTDTASHIHTARSSPAPYSPFRRRAHSPTAFSGPMARPPPCPPRPPHRRA